ncbi:hypothetical protein TrST_g14349 [Triparma strigata]|uniref:Pentatricopeptide repeat-containing protein n=1 Tax=Triparma strigata TaxID=1606541 RepID=A0A9W7AZ82_9STRA|nr:hypothetical protein TrST_g14349 [Triparma strigata]
MDRQIHEYLTTLDTPPSPSFVTNALLTTSRSLNLKSTADSLLLSSILKKNISTSTFNKYLLVHYHKLKGGENTLLNTDLQSFISELLKTSSPSPSNDQGGISSPLSVLETLPESAYDYNQMNPERFSVKFSDDEVHGRQTTASSVVAVRAVYLMIREGGDCLPDNTTWEIVFKILEMNRHSQTALSLLNKMSNYIPPPPSFPSHRRSSPSYGFSPPTSSMFFTVLLSLCKTPNQSSAALKLLLSMRNTTFQPTPAHYTAVIRSFGRDNKPLDATMLLWNTMPLNGLTPDPHTYEAAIRACADYKEMPRTEVSNRPKHFEVSDRPELPTAYKLLLEASSKFPSSVTPNSYLYILHAISRLPSPFDPPQTHQYSLDTFSLHLHSSPSPSPLILKAFKHNLLLYHISTIMSSSHFPPQPLLSDLDSILLPLPHRTRSIVMKSFTPSDPMLIYLKSLNSSSHYKNLRRDSDNNIIDDEECEEDSFDNIYYDDESFNEREYEDGTEKKNNRKEKEDNSSWW